MRVPLFSVVFTFPSVFLFFFLFSWDGHLVHYNIKVVLLTLDLKDALIH